MHRRLRFARTCQLFLLFPALHPALHSAAATETRPDVLIVADAAETANPLRPVPGAPIHYAIIGMTVSDIGYSRAGVPTPDEATVRRELVAALASQGFVEAHLGGPRPQIALFVTWGQANLDGDLLDQTETSTDPDTGEAITEGSSRPIGQNTRQMVLLTGANKLDWTRRNNAALESIKEAFREDRLYLLVAALDAEALSRKEKRLLWRTRISIDDLGNNLIRSLAPMLADAAPFFGRNEAQPVLINQQVRQTEVIVGDVQVVEPDSAPPAPSPNP